MAARKFYVDGITSEVVSETKIYFILESGTWIRKDNFRTMGDGRIALDVSGPGGASSSIDSEVQMREVTYPRFVVALAELRNEIVKFLEETTEDNIPEGLAEHGDEIQELITGIYVFLAGVRSNADASTGT
jgi:hypothetical protein